MACDTESMAQKSYFLGLLQLFLSVEIDEPYCQIGECIELLSRVSRKSKIVPVDVIK